MGAEADVCVLTRLCPLVCPTGNNALKTELQFSDMYCLMAAHVYIDLWRDTGESSSGRVPPPRSISSAALSVLQGTRTRCGRRLASSRTVCLAVPPTLSSNCCCCSSTVTWEPSSPSWIFITTWTPNTSSTTPSGQSHLRVDTVETSLSSSSRGQTGVCLFSLQLSADTLR